MLKKAIRSLTPPLLWDGIKNLRRQRPIHDWDSAVRIAGSYEDEALTRFRAERSLLYSRHGIEPQVENSPLFWLASDATGPISIVDFGGAFGEYGAGLISRIPTCKFTVVETERVVSLAQRGPVEFSTQIPEAFDIFHASGSLQYLADPYAVLDVAFSRATSAVVLERTFFSEQDRFFVQVSSLYDNGAGEIPKGHKNRKITYPARTLSEAVLNTMANRHGFTLLYRHNEPDEISLAGIGTRLLVYRRP